MALFSLLGLMPPWQRAAAIVQNDSAARREWVYHWLGPVEYALYFLFYVYLVPRLGYLPSTLLVFPLLVFRAGYRERKYFALSWVVGVVIVVLFKSLLQVKIPGGEIYSLLPDGIRNFWIQRF